MNLKIIDYFSRSIPVRMKGKFVFIVFQQSFDIGPMLVNGQNTSEKRDQKSRDLISQIPVREMSQQKNRHLDGKENSYRNGS